jgi:magnesium chelatase subunit I
VTSTLRGKVEFESGEEGREVEILAHLLRTSTADTFRARMSGIDLSGFINLVAEGDIVTTGELVSADEILQQVGTVPGLAKMLGRLDLGDAPTKGEAASGIEFVLEGLHLTRRMSKAQTDEGRTLYGSRE